MSVSASHSKAGSKSRKSKIITLRLPSDQLSRFPSSQPPSKTSSSAPSVKKDEPTPPSIQHPDLTSTAAAADKASDSNATPVPPTAPTDQDPNSLALPKPKRKGGWPAGKKRAPPAIDGNALPKERGRPGPKKKPRLADGTIDRTNETGVVPKAVPGVPAHKLGPKANTGAINAGLRALDRSGKPCRRWERKPLELKSFTGTVWGMSSWRAPQSNMRDETKSDSTGSSEVASGAPNGSGDKPMQSSAVPSEERSHSGVDAGGDTTMANAMESSPAPVAATAPAEA